MIKVLPYTPKSRMHYKKLIRAMLGFYKEVAPEYEVTPDEFFEEITDFAMLSVRVQPNGSGPLDFDLLSPLDNAETVEVKTRAFLESASGQWAEIEALVREFDQPVEDDIAPVAVDPNSKGDKSGKRKL